MIYSIGDRVALAERVGNTATVHKGTIVKVFEEIHSVDVKIDNSERTRQISRMISICKLGDD